MSDKVLVKVVYQGDAVCGQSGYMKIESENVVAFYLDGWGNTGRIYPVSTSSQTYHDGKMHDFPSIVFEDGQEESAFTEIYFPEYGGWNVHAVSGGKTMAICLTKRKSK